MNNVELIGRLTKDPQISYTSETNTCVAVFSIAVNRPTKEKQADYPRIRVYGKQAENVEKYVHKGDMVGIVGSLETGSYDGKNGKVYYTDVVASRVEFLESPKEKHSYSAAANKIEQEDAFEALEENVPF